MNIEPNREVVKKKDAEKPGDTDKILFLGLAESGKTTIIKTLIEGYIPTKNASYSATIQYERKFATVYEKNVTFFDLGGQTTFLDRFVGNTAEFFFSDVKMLIFVIDMTAVTEFSRAMFYLEKVHKNLVQYSSKAPLIVFFHKVDAISASQLKETAEQFKLQISSKISPQIEFFETSIFNDSVVKTFTTLFKEYVNVKISKNLILDHFATENAKITNYIHYIDANGRNLFTNASVNRNSAMNIISTIAKLLSHIDQDNNSSDLNTSLLVNNGDKLYFINVFANGDILYISYSKKLMVKENYSIARIYNASLMLVSQLEPIDDQEL